MRNRCKFAVTFEVWNEESAEIGETDEKGYIAESCDLRDAVLAVQSTRTCEVGGVESIDAYERTVTIANSMEYRTGDYESRTLHIPRSVSAASARRIRRLLGAK